VTARPAPAPPDFGAALAWARRRLRTSEDAACESAALLSFLTGRPRTFLLAHPEAEFSPALWTSYRALVARCAAGEPLAYLTGEREFYGLAFTVTPDVLIPRPETELLVETALGWLSTRNNALRAIDVGTGSGCIAVVLTVRTEGLRPAATDISAAALAVAARNAARHGAADRITFVQADLLAPFHGPFDLICANLPYCQTAALETLPVVQYEPRAALDGGVDGLRPIERLLKQAQTRLAAEGCILLEIESSLSASSLDLARRFFGDARISLRQDLAGLDRLIEIVR
jgi:release factor glutamine methyltransferase